MTVKADLKLGKTRVFFYVEANPGCTFFAAVLAGWPDATRENRTARFRGYQRVRGMVKRGILQEAGGKLYPANEPPF